MTSAEGRVNDALDFLQGGIPDGDHRKAWIIDQVVRILTDCPTVSKTGKDYKGNDYRYWAKGESEAYLQFVGDYQAGEDGPNTYEWDEGIAP